MRPINSVCLYLAIAMELFLVSLLNGLVYGMLLFMLASGLTLIFSMMGVLNFAHASIYMLGAYLAYQISRYVGFWPALVIAPVLCGAASAPRSRCMGCARCTTTATSPSCCSPSASSSSSSGCADDLGHAADALPRAELPRLPAVHASTATISRPIAASCCWSRRGCSCATWLLLKKTRIGLIIQAVADPSRHGQRAGPQRAAGCSPSCSPAARLLAGLAGVIGGNYLTTEPAMASRMGPIVFVVVVFGGLGSLAGLLHRLDPHGHGADLRRGDRRLARRSAGAARHRDLAGDTCSARS